MPKNETRLYKRLKTAPPEQDVDTKKRNLMQAIK
jgi:hypothetical protein